MILKSLFLLFFIISTSALAAPYREPPAPGTYSYRGNFTLETRVRYEAVYGFQEAGQVRLKELRAEGYACSNTGREIYRCQMILSPEQGREEIRSRLKEKLEGKSLVVGKLSGTPFVVNEGDNLIEYEVPQPLEFSGFKYKIYSLFGLGNVWSIRLGKAGTDNFFQFSLDPSSEPSLALIIAVTESSVAYSTYFVMADFRRM